MCIVCLAQRPALCYDSAVDRRLWTRPEGTGKYRSELSLSKGHWVRGWELYLKTVWNSSDSIEAVQQLNSKYSHFMCYDLLRALRAETKTYRR